PTGLRALFLLRASLAGAPAGGASLRSARASGARAVLVVAKFAVLVEVTLRPGIADPQGATIERALPALGFDGVEGVRVGKAIRFTVEAPDVETARSRVDDLCQKFLTNPVIESADITIEGGSAP